MLQGVCQAPLGQGLGNPSNHRHAELPTREAQGTELFEERRLFLGGLLLRGLLDGLELWRQVA